MFKVLLEKQSWMDMRMPWLSVRRLTPAHRKNDYVSFMAFSNQVLRSIYLKEKTQVYLGS